MIKQVTSQSAVSTQGSVDKCLSHLAWL